MGTVKVVVDFEKCTGIGMCESLAPEFFEINDDGDLDVLRDDIDPPSLSEVEEAVTACPTAALRIQA